MVNNLTYTILNVIFFTPLYLVLFLFFRKTMKQNIPLIFVSILFAVVAFFLIDPIATYWHAWGYDYSKTLGITFGKSVLEELIWAVLVCNVLSIVVAASAEREENGKSFFHLPTRSSHSHKKKSSNSRSR